MSAKSRFIVPVVGATALVAWTIALAQALPRLLAGPLCSSRQDVWSMAGHCPACYVAAALTLVFGIGLALARPKAAPVGFLARRRALVPG